MLLRRVIPCLDVDKGRVVKGVEFVNLRDAGDPVELAVRYQDEGADEIVFLDITASHEKRDTIVDLARRTANDVFVPFTIGGGVRELADAHAVLDAGADKVSINSAGSSNAARLTATLSAPARSSERASSRPEIPPPTVNGMKTLSAVRRASSTMVSRFSCEAVMSRKTSSSAPSAS